jgi:signal transduction histidine kinase
MKDDDHKYVEALQRIDAVPVILNVVCSATGMGFAAIARVTEEKWVACATRDEIKFGLQPGGELDLKTTICNEIRHSRSPVIIDDVETDPIYCKHRTPAHYGFRSYISMPIFRGNGAFFGTLCAIDPKPAHVSRVEIVNMFRLFADLIGFHLDADDRLEERERTIAEQRISQDVRDQFIAVLGHDLRNPLAAIDAGMALLERTELDNKSKITVSLVRKSVKRMSELVDNVLDFARGRLGTGITVTKSTAIPLEPVLQHVVDEMKSSSIGHAITAKFDLRRPVSCDASRIGQMLSNLIANAISHGEKDGQVWVMASSDEIKFNLTVSNRGTAIPREVQEGLFQPFSREVGGGRRAGLGLGLYICAEIARAHQGHLDVQSSADETRFTFTMPQSA